MSRLKILGWLLIFCFGLALNYAADVKSKDAEWFVVKKVKPGMREISLAIAVQDEADDAFFDDLAKRMQEVSNKFWTITQGQFYIKEISLRDKCSDGKIIVKKGAKDWEMISGKDARSGVGAQTHQMDTNRWYEIIAGKANVLFLTHETMHGMFKFIDEDKCDCTMNGNQSEGHEIFKLCDDQTHRGGGKSCWKLLLERYPDMKYPNPAFKADSKPPEMKVKKEHRKDFDTKRGEMLDKKEELMNRGFSELEKKDVDGSINTFKQILKIDPDDPGAYYNIACTYAITEKRKEAIENLTKALENGFDNYELLQTDEDFTNIRNSSDFKNLLEKYKPR